MSHIILTTELHLWIPTIAAWLSINMEIVKVEVLTMLQGKEPINDFQSKNFNDEVSSVRAC